MSISNTWFRLETERLILRPFQFEDAEELMKRVNENTDHLRRWMPWGHELPVSLDKQNANIRKWTAYFTADTDYVYGMFDKKTGEIIGSTGLHTRQGKGILEIGYWIRKDKQGFGYTTEAAKEMERVAFECLQAEKVEIRCEHKNLPSAKVAERLGYTHEYTYTLLEREENGERRKLMVWVKFRKP